MEIFKIIGIGLLTCFFAVIIKQIRPEFYVVVILCGSVAMLIMILGKFSYVYNYFYSVIKKTNIDSGLIIMVLKILGIGYLTEFACGICEDSGNSALGDKIVLAGKVVILCMMMPVIINLLDSLIKILP